MPHLDRLFKFTDKCQNCCNNGIKKSDLFLETGFLSDRTGDRVRSGSNGVAERGNLGVCLALPSLLGKLCVCFDHTSTGTWSGDVTALPEKRPVELSKCFVTNLPRRSRQFGALLLCLLHCVCILLRLEKVEIHEE